MKLSPVPLLGPAPVRLLAALALAGCGPNEAAEVTVGRPAPSYATRTLAGDSASLRGLRGRAVLLNVWATWCMPCRQEIPYLEQLYASHRGEGLDIIGVSIDAPFEEAKIATFAKEMGMTYPIWLDPDRRVANVFFAYGVPASYLLDRKGVLRWQHVGVLRRTNDEFTSALRAALREGTSP
jgi:peroxiredoxin